MIMVGDVVKALSKSIQFSGYGRVFDVKDNGDIVIIYDEHSLFHIVKPRYITHNKTALHRERLFDQNWKRLINL